MGAPDPRQAVLDQLFRPPGIWTPGGKSPGGIESGTVRGGNPFRADPSTVRFVKHRQSAQRHVYFVTFQGTIHCHEPDRLYRWSYMYPVERDPTGGWRVCGGAGGAGGGPRRSTPWVNLGGGGWPDQFYAGGSIDAADTRVAAIELRFANGLVLHDDADGQAALFITDEHVEMPATVALIDTAGGEIATHAAFPAD
jgi:hypothetical protein